MPFNIVHVAVLNYVSKFIHRRGNPFISGTITVVLRAPELHCLHSYDQVVLSYLSNTCEQKTNISSTFTYDVM